MTIVVFFSIHIIMINIAFKVKVKRIYDENNSLSSPQFIIND